MEAPTILLVDDNAGDRRLVVEAFRKTGSSSAIHEVEDGIEAIEWLMRGCNYVGTRPPALIILDLNLPAKHGLEVLREIKTNSELGKIPVIVFGASSDGKDVETCYSLGANCYVRKPIDLEAFFTILACIETFWLHIVSLPSLRQ